LCRPRSGRWVRHGANLRLFGYLGQTPLRNSRSCGAFAPRVRRSAAVFAERLPLSGSLPQIARAKTTSATFCDAGTLTSGMAAGTVTPSSKRLQHKFSARLTALH
jgi:hypothetical protein